MQLHVYEVRPRKDKRGVDLISDVLPFGRVYDAACNVVETREQKAISKNREP